MKLRLSRRTTNSKYFKGTTYHLDTIEEAWIGNEMGNFAEYIWDKLKLPQKDGSYWIEIKLEGEE